MNLFYPVCLILTCSLVRAQESFVDINFGYTVSKSILGVSYAKNGYEVNIGLKRTEWSLDEGSSDLTPGLTLIRNIGKYGPYLSTGIILRNQRLEYFVPDPDSLTTLRSHRIENVNDWISPLITLGLGHTVQGVHWGVHFDANMGVPASSRILHDRNYTIGIGISHRFRLH